MTPKNNSAAKKNKKMLITRVLIGATIGLVLISIFLSGTGEPHPDWGKYWMLRPLIIVPFAGAMGGLCNYVLVRFHNLIGINKTIAIILSAIIFIVGLWLGSVLGLVGTYWD